MNVHILEKGLFSALTVTKLSAPSIIFVNTFACTLMRGLLNVLFVQKHLDNHNTSGKNNTFHFCHFFFFIFSFFVYGRAHSYIHRSQDEPVPCSVCGKVFRNRILLMSHRRIHKQARNDHMSHSNSGLMTDNASTDQIHGSTHMDSGTLLNIIVLTDGNDC